jgi:hypothetical protein
LASYFNIVSLDGATPPLFTQRILLLDTDGRPFSAMVGPAVGDVESRYEVQGLIADDMSILCDVAVRGCLTSLSPMISLRLAAFPQLHLFCGLSCESRGSIGQAARLSGSAGELVEPVAE